MLDGLPPEPDKVAEMHGFDRNTRRLPTGKKRSGNGIWFALAAIPVMGIAAMLMLQSGPDNSIEGIDVHAPSAVLAAAEATTLT